MRRTLATPYFATSASRPSIAEAWALSASISTASRRWPSSALAPALRVPFAAIARSCSPGPGQECQNPATDTEERRDENPPASVDAGRGDGGERRGRRRSGAAAAEARGAMHARARRVGEIDRLLPCAARRRHAVHLRRGGRR